MVRGRWDQLCSILNFLVFVVFGSTFYVSQHLSFDLTGCVKSLGLVSQPLLVQMARLLERPGARGLTCSAKSLASA